MELSERKIYSVSEITRSIKDRLEAEFSFIFVEGEIGNFTKATSGHLYFNIKDNSAQLACVMWRNQARLLRFAPEVGMVVVCRGRISIYEPRGTYQLILDSLIPKGVGELQLAFEQLKKRLHAEGLFDQEHKKSLPALPRRIGLVTSPSGAAVRDIIRVITDRFENPDILILPARVQGAGAAQEIAEMIELANRRSLCDVLIIGRGGGSMEDLWSFNEEIVARAIFTSKIPLISAVGHEIDFTISDLVADVRAPTPSVAGELVIPKKDDLLRRVKENYEEIVLQIATFLNRRRQNMETVTARLRDPKGKLETYMIKADDLADRMQTTFRHRLVLAGRNLDGLIADLGKVDLHGRITESRSLVAERVRSIRQRVPRLIGEKQLQFSVQDQKLKALSPLAVLQRGFAIVHHQPSGKVLRQASLVKPDDQLRIRLAQGEITARVDQRKKDKKDS